MTLIVGVASGASGEHTRARAVSGHRDMPLRTDIPEIPYRKQHQMKFRHNTSIVNIIILHCILETHFFSYSNYMCPITAIIGFPDKWYVRNGKQIL